MQICIGVREALHTPKKKLINYTRREDMLITLTLHTNNMHDLQGRKNKSL